jgi:uncharacterized protein YjbI with pentapeptide repeats
MKSKWKIYLFYASLIIIGGGLVFILIQTVLTKNTGFEKKTLWDWMELLVIPLVLVFGAFILNRSERESERQQAEERAKLEREIANDRQQEAALQAYFDRMSDLLLKEKLRTTKKAEVRDVARTRTISIMRVLDRRRNNLVIQFLREARVVTDKNSILNGAEMEGMDLQRLHLNEVYMQGANLEGADLQDAYLYQANLQGARLWRANLRNTILQRANLSEAILQEANLQDAFLWEANLQSALLLDTNLEGADLFQVNLQGARLQGANLSEANLSEEGKLSAIVTEEQLAEAESLKGATMPDGTKHE